MLVPSKMGLVDVELYALEVLRLPIQDVAVQVAGIVHDDLLRQLGEPCQEDLKTLSCGSTESILA